MTRRLIPMLLAAAALVGAVLVTRGGDEETYTLKMRLANAGGLRDGSPVVIGGVPVGKVRLDAERDYVEASLDLDEQYAPVGRDAIAGIIAQNVIGQKQVRIEIGHRGDPAPDGYRLPARQILETTDLDQLLGALDPDTRTRLAIMINETGSAFAGRRVDFRTLLRDVGPALSDGGKVLGELTEDNRALTNLVSKSDPFVAELAAQRRRFARVLDNAGQTVDTIAAKRTALRATLRQAPGALRSARTFLTELRRTTTPLAQTSTLLRKTAPSLSEVLDRIGPFERDAAPTIRALAPLGPILSRTASRTTPLIKKLIPTTADLKALAGNEIPPAGATLNGSADNLIATLDNWSHAIQFRDGMSHVFRGEVSAAPDFLYQSLIDRLLDLLPKAKAKTGKGGAAVAASPKPKPQAQTPADAGSPPLELPKAPSDVPLLPKVTHDVQDLIHKLLPPQTGKSDDSEPENGARRLLDYLLGPG
jgi:phospholipid/cholesterol/gamma-HCH transport system substrate-binding protein